MIVRVVPPGVVVGVGRVVADLPVAPRFASPRHPRYAFSWGGSALAIAENTPMHLGRVSSLRPWQRYVLERALEADESGALLWRTVIVSAPRQVGKSVVERVACYWRLLQSELFGQGQDVLHVAHKLDAAKEVWRPAARFVHERFGQRFVRYGTGECRIELPDGSRWMIQAANDGAGVAFALTMVLVDEAWRVPRSVVDASLMPTMAEAESPQLWLVSTAGTSTSDLMRAYRNAALADAPDTLLLEWSADDAAEVDIADPGVWRSASPHWDERRAGRVRHAFASVDEWTFRQQWLNQWIPSLAAPMFDAQAVDALTTTAPLPDEPVAFGVDVAFDRSQAAIVAYAGGVVEVVECAEGTQWVYPRLVELCERWQPVGVAFDHGGPAQNIADQLGAHEAHGHRVATLNGRDMASASAEWCDRASAGTVAVRPHPALVVALGAARKRPYGQAWIFARDASASGVPLLAAVLAVAARSHVPTDVEASAIW